MSKIGIMLVLEDKELILLKRTSNPTDNIPPHITLYVLETNEKNKQIIKTRAEQISKKFLPIELNINNITKTNYGTLLGVDDTDKLKQFHQEIVNELVKFRDKNAFSKAKKFYNEFSKQEQELINKYGRANVMQKFNPHITLGKINKIPKFNPKKIIINKITIYYDKGSGWEKI